MIQIKRLLPALLLSICSSVANAETKSNVDIGALSLLELMSVEVTTAAKVPEKIRDTPASVYLVGRTDIERQGHNSLTDIFENVPGFYNLNSYNGVSGNFGIRGFLNARSQNGSVAILVNGIRQTALSSRSNPMELLNLPVEAIDRIEIIRGPNAVIYGNGASFGAINIITNESFHNDQFSTSYGSLNSKRSALRWSETSDNAHVIVNASISTSDGNDYKLSDLMGETGADEYNQQFPVPLPEGINTKDRLQQEQKFLQVSGAINDLRFDFSHNESNSEYFYVAPAVVDGTVRSTSSSRATIAYNKDLGDTLNLDAQVSYSNEDLKETYDSLFPGFVGLRTLDFYTWNYELLLSYTPTDRINIVSGFERQSMFDLYELTHVPLLGVNNEVIKKAERTTNALYSQLNVQLTEKLRAVLGVRTEEQRAYHRQYFENIEADPTPSRTRRAPTTRNTTPRASLIYQHSPAQVLKLMAGNSIKLVNRQKHDTEDEKYETIEANYVYTSENNLFSASIFNNSMKNLIVENILIVEGEEAASYSTSSGDISTNGIELLFKTHWTEEISTEIGATWQDSKNRSFSTDDVSYSPMLVSNLKLNYHKNNFSSSFLMRYVDGMLPQYTEPQLVDEKAEAPGSYSGHAVPSYIVADLSARWDNLWDRGYLSLQLTNIFDQEIRYPNNSFNSAILDEGLIGNGRGARITLGIDF